MRPNNSFKPNLLRSTNNMAGKACHVAGSATQVGLTQALELAMSLLDKLFPKASSQADRFGLSEGWRRLCIAMAGLWLAFWLTRAGLLQAEVWECPYAFVSACRDEVRQIWWLVGLAIAGPFLISAVARVAHWVARGFGQAAERKF